MKFAAQPRFARNFSRSRRTIARRVWQDAERDATAVTRYKIALYSASRRLRNIAVAAAAAAIDRR